MICIVARIEVNANTAFTVLAEKSSVRIEPAPIGAPPQVRHMASWSYYTGTGISIGFGNDMRMSVSGSSVILHQIYNEKTGGWIFRGYLRAGAASTAQFFNAAGGASSIFSQGQYVDVNVNASFGFISFSNPATFNEAAPPAGSEGVTGEVDTEKTPRNVP